MKKLAFIFLCMLVALSLTGCANRYPVIHLYTQAVGGFVEIDLGNKQLKFNTFDRIDDESGTKLILYFDKEEG